MVKDLITLKLTEGEAEDLLDKLEFIAYTVADIQKQIEGNK